MQQPSHVTISEDTIKQDTSTISKRSSGSVDAAGAASTISINTATQSSLPPFELSGSQTLVQFQVTVQQYLTSHPDLHQLVASAMVFHSDRILLVQRSPDEIGHANCWETPGGSCDREDATVLHSAARELFEETGLHVTRFNHQVGEGLRFETGSGNQRKQWVKFSFDVDIGEAKGTVTQEQLGEFIKLDPLEHQQWLWVTEHEIWSSRAGKVDLKFVSPELRLIILEGFAGRKPGNIEQIGNA
jgi:8-oxo-dGTP pyrophosphatase MutT (NUDIX family)